MTTATPPLRIFARAGDFIHVPAWLPHMESNATDTQPFRRIVVGSTPNPIVVTLPDDHWDRVA
jgi:uncharacterized RmlC-like cupin family protein